ncbi:MAG: NAD(P)H-dependent oxidoreductase [Firmicutes bacterium]|nr:NAD(P)H-dependent oxidoreductase [Bacillota bacterium]
MSKNITITALIGSLRHKSFNRGLFNYLTQVIPDAVVLTETRIDTLPLYNEDIGYPPTVHAFFSSLQTAHGILFITPEYNYSIPAPLKNAIDWASRDPQQSALHQKPAAIMGVSQGAFGTVRAQMHLRNTLVFLDMNVLNKPEVLVNFAGSKFNEQGCLTDNSTQAITQQLLHRLIAAAQTFQSSHAH